MRKLLLLLTGAALALALTGCGTTAAVRPVTAWNHALAVPEVAEWYVSHSAPAILESLSPAQTRRWRRYRPATTVDLNGETMVVRFESPFGAAPHRLEVSVARKTGEVLSIAPK